MSRSTKHLVRHYLEMVAAMFAGMAVLGFPADRAMDAMSATSDELMFLGMATTMTAGMVAWMIHRGHGWRANVEMSPQLVPKAPITHPAGGLSTAIPRNIAATISR